MGLRMNPLWWILSLWTGFLTYSGAHVFPLNHGSYRGASPSESPLGNYSSAGISVDGEPCAQIGMDVIREGGNAVDGAIAALFCNGVATPQSMGIGGGFFMTIYDKKAQKVVVLNAREQAPSYVDPNMFESNEIGAQQGPLASAIPGEILGYYEAKVQYGNPEISWARLIQPTVDLCRNGITNSQSAASAMAQKTNEIKADAGLSATFIDPETGKVYQAGDVYTRPNLADTLERIATNGAAEFYSGQTAHNLIRDLEDIGGLMTLEDLAGYKIEWRVPVVSDLGQGLTLHTVPVPGSGVVLIFIMNILKNYGFPSKGPIEETPLMFHRVAEAFKWAYAQRTKLGDPFDESITDFINQLAANMTSEEWAQNAFSLIDDEATVNDPEFYGADFSASDDHGTAHVSVIDPNGNAVSVTSTINLFFGSKFLSPSTGIIMNDIMDDFSYPNITNQFDIPPSPNNYPKPGKRPLSSMCPSLVIDANGDPRLAIGAAGGPKITTATALATMRHLWLHEDIKMAIDNARIHHQLFPMTCRYETFQPQDVVDFLASRGHVMEDQSSGGNVHGVAVENGRVYANSDFRKSGSIDGF
eukprot:maker-scaffold14_size734282-snap-gene-1.21 protein:Tk11280 transcript:maker-scaffold14_size734282-snap-gene-1.21-mRNA-1 annotation:"gamma-glutamyltranspeptidase 1"